jgi:predicted Zn-dependent peptidase
MTIELSELSNGMRVVTHHIPHFETATVGISVNTGARAELPSEHGIAHMLEHMAFKGTPTRDARQIAEEIEAVGGGLNASTSLENTDYYARVLKDDVEVALDILADILQNPVFAEEELEREREVIMQEIASVQDSPDELVFDLAQETAYPDQALGRPILGTSESVSHLAASDLEAYRAAAYGPRRMVLSAAGAVDHAKICATAEKLFIALPGSESREIEHARYTGGHQTLSRPFEQCHILLAFEGVSFRDEELFTSKIYSVMFGGGMSSRLFQEVRERRGLCYDIHAFDWSFADSGLFGIHAATGPEQTAELVRVVLQEISTMIEHGPRDDEIARAKAQLKAALLMSLESSEARASQLARDVLSFGRPIPTAELVSRIESVTRENVRDLALKLHMGSAITSAAVGPRPAAQAVRRLVEESGLRAQVLH